MRLLPVATQRLLLCLLVTVVAIGLAPTAAMGAAGADTVGSYDYDWLAVARVDSREASGAQPSTPQLTGAQEWSFPPPIWAQGTSTTRLSRSVATEAEPGVASVFHHTTSQAVDAISREGLFPGSYATPTEGLSPLQAHIELALNPAGGARNAILEIDLAGLRSAGYEIPEISRVTGAYGMAGGGYEMQFPYAIPPEFIKVIQP